MRFLIPRIDFPQSARRSRYRTMSDPISKISCPLIALEINAARQLTAYLQESLFLCGKKR